VPFVYSRFFGLLDLEIFGGKVDFLGIFGPKFFSKLFFLSKPFFLGNSILLSTNKIFLFFLEFWFGWI
jgi:hypothetical protein